MDNGQWTWVTQNVCNISKPFKNPTLKVCQQWFSFFSKKHDLCACAQFQNVSSLSTQYVQTVQTVCSDNRKTRFFCFAQIQIMCREVHKHVPESSLTHHGVSKVTGFESLSYPVKGQSGKTPSQMLNQFTLLSKTYFLNFYFRYLGKILNHGQNI